jgi:hypothetical protein
VKRGRVKRAVVILCYNANEPNWEYVVWGDPNNPGRLPTGLKVAVELNVEVIIIVSSAYGRNGKSSGELMVELWYQNIGEIHKFTIYNYILGPMSTEEIKAILDEKVMLVKEPVTNTREELRVVVRVLKELGITEMIIVTSLDHIMRAMRDAIVISLKEYSGLFIWGIPSGTPYSWIPLRDEDVADIMEKVVVVEPRISSKLDISRIFNIIFHNPQVLEEVKATLEKYSK